MQVEDKVGIVLHLLVQHCGSEMEKAMGRGVAIVDVAQFVQISDTLPSELDEEPRFALAGSCQ